MSLTVLTDLTAASLFMGLATWFSYKAGFRWQVSLIYAVFLVLLLVALPAFMDERATKWCVEGVVLGFAATILRRRLEAFVAWRAARMIWAARTPFPTPIAELKKQQFWSKGTRPRKMLPRHRRGGILA